MDQSLTHIGRYAIRRRLGGRVGTVYLAHDTDLQRDVAIRVLPESALVAPARSPSSRHEPRPPVHPNVAAFFGVEPLGSRACLVMEYVEGETLTAIALREPSATLLQKVQWLEQLCAGVAEAHRHGLFHGRLSPSEVMIDRAGQVKVLGFELGWLPAGASGGTPGYMAPEQLIEGTVDPRADVFSIGAIAYELFTGAKAFPGDTVVAINQNVRLADPDLAGLVVAAVPSSLVSILARALKMPPSDRFASLDEFQEALAQARAGIEPVTKPILTPPPEQIQFTVYRPRAVQPDVWHPLLVFTHLADSPPGVPEHAPTPLEQVRELARRALGARLDTFRDSTADARQDVPRESEITLVPSMPGVEFNPQRRTFGWVQDVQQEGFLFRVGRGLLGTVARGRLSAFLGVMLIADVDLAIRVDASVADDVPTEPVGAAAYRKIFASYSRRDAEIVRQFEAFAHTLGDRYLVDQSALRAGEEWSPAILRLIDEADVFQLFWSSNVVKKPQELRREWEYALSLRRPSFVRPTYWEDPMPEAPQEDLPPETLRKLEFQRIALLTAPATPRDTARDTKILLHVHELTSVSVSEAESARLRDSYIAGILERANRAVAGGDLSRALQACEEALAVDHDHPAARELKQRVDTIRAEEGARQMRRQQMDVMAERRRHDAQMEEARAAELARARHEAEERARREVEEQERHGAEERARRDAEQRGALELRRRREQAARDRELLEPQPGPPPPSSAPATLSSPDGAPVPPLAAVARQPPGAPVSRSSPPAKNRVPAIWWIAPILAMLIGLAVWWITAS